MVKHPKVTAPEINGCILKWLPTRANGAKLAYYHIDCIPENLEVAPRITQRFSVQEINACMTRRIRNNEKHLISTKTHKQERFINVQRASTRPEKAKLRTIQLAKQRQQRREMDALGLIGNFADAAKRRKQIVKLGNFLSFQLPKCLPGTVYQFRIAGENRYVSF